MKKIAILTCLHSVGSCCTGASCLSAFYNRSGAFAQYQQEELQLVAFFNATAVIRLPGPMTAWKKKWKES